MDVFGHDCNEIAAQLQRQGFGDRPIGDYIASVILANS